MVASSMRIDGRVRLSNIKCNHYLTKGPVLGNAVGFHLVLFN